jgi:murein DD-endopeptidase MepM/ murein hydrolase activator NlpD
LSARYGQRGGIWSAGWHTGLDFRVKSGTPVVAAANGTVIASGWGGAYGYRIEVDHGNGYVTAYNHLSKIEITDGKVAAGQEIGKSGSSGNTTGPHLHFEVTKDGEFMNPSSWLWGN